MLRTHEQHSRAKLITTVLSVLVVAGVVIIVDHIRSQKPATTTLSQAAAAAKDPNASATDTNSSTPAPSAPTTSTSSSTTGYTNGTYTATSSYFVPSGQESIKVNVTLAGGVITTVSIQNSQNDPTSAQFQQSFASQYKSYVVGQKISDLHLGIVAGASDTAQGFDTALDQIANKAKA